MGFYEMIRALGVHIFISIYIRVEKSIKELNTVIADLTLIIKERLLVGNDVGSERIKGYINYERYKFN